MSTIDTEKISEWMEEWASENENKYFIDELGEWKKVENLRNDLRTKMSKCSRPYLEI
jgi:hypothetical protein